MTRHDDIVAGRVHGAAPTLTPPLITKDNLDVAERAAGSPAATPSASRPAVSDN